MRRVCARNNGQPKENNKIFIPKVVGRSVVVLLRSRDARGKGVGSSATAESRATIEFLPSHLSISFFLYVMYKKRRIEMVRRKGSRHLLGDDD